MELDDRKTTILRATIRNYMDTDEPVDSRTISKYTESKWSSVTIRDKTSDLEGMDYIMQPHTSAGKIPSNKGYRFYVDQIMKERELQMTELQELMIQRMDRLGLMLKQLAKLLANNTNYAVLISAPQYHHSKLKFTQLSRMDTYKLLIMTVVEDNIIKNTMVTIREEIEGEELLNLNILLNGSLDGLTIEEVNLGVTSSLREQTDNHSQMVNLVLNEVVDAIKAGEGDLQIYTSGVTNTFKYPELDDGEKASQLLGALERTELLQNLISDVSESEENSGIQIYIGDKTPVQAMKDCGVVTANYELGEGIRETIGVIGPKRMDYGKVLKTLKTLTTQLGMTFRKDER